MTSTKRAFLIASWVACCLFGLQPVWSQSLDGVWEITSLVDNGRVIDPAVVQRDYVADGKLMIRGSQAQLLMPTTRQLRQVPFAVDVKQSPPTINVALTSTSGAHGIYLVTGDVAVICLATHTKPLPTAIASAPGSENLLLTLKRIPPPAPANSPPAGASPVAPAPPAPVMDYSDDKLKQMLTGTWGHQDKDTTRMLTLNSDNSMSSAVTWKDKFKRIFHSDVRSSGTWKVQQGVVIASITTSTDKNLRGQVFSYRIRSITDRELQAVDQNGNIRQEWKAPQ
jgi:uncharacterized protein (TIGR03067 family)